MWSIWMTLILTTFVQCKTMTLRDIETLLEDCDRKLYNCQNENNKICHCDNLCHYYKDCCYDAPQKSGSLPGEDIYFTEKASCHKLTFQNGTPTVSIDTIFMISKCQNAWEDTIVQEKCESIFLDDMLDMFPVTSTNPYQSITFKNKYCARCNGVNDWTAWRRFTIDYRGANRFPETRSSFLNSILMSLKCTECTYRFIPFENFNVRYCDSRIHATRNTSIEEESSYTCQTGPIGTITSITKTGVWTFYRNRECAEHALSNIDSGDIDLIGCIKKVVNQMNAGISASLDLSPLHPRAINSCEKTEIYLSAKDGCHMLYCPYEFVNFQGECVYIRSDFEVDHGITLGLLFQVNATFDSDVAAQMTNALYPVAQMARMFNARSFKFSSHCLYRTIAGLTKNTGKTCTFLEVTMATATFKPKGASYRHALNRTIKQDLEGYSVVLDNDVLLEHVNDVNDHSCVSRETVRSSRYMMSNFVRYQKYDLPCGAVKLETHTDTDNSTNSFNLSYSLPPNKTAIAENDVIYVGDAYFICTHTYMTLYTEKATAGSDSHYTGHRTGMMAVSLLVLHIFHYYVIN